MPNCKTKHTTEEQVVVNQEFAEVLRDAIGHSAHEL